MLRKSLNKEALSSKSNTIPSSCTLQITEFYTKCRVLRHTCFCTCLCLEYILRLQQRGVGLSKSFKCQINILQMEKTAIFRKQIQNSLITEFKSSFFAFWAKWKDGKMEEWKDVWLLNIVGTIWKYLGWNIHGKSHNNGTGFCFFVYVYIPQCTHQLGKVWLSYSQHAHAVKCFLHPKGIYFMLTLALYHIVPVNHNDFCVRTYI